MLYSRRKLARNPHISIPAANEKEHAKKDVFYKFGLERQKKKKLGGTKKDHKASQFKYEWEKGGDPLRTGFMNISTFWNRAFSCGRRGRVCEGSGMLAGVRKGYTEGWLKELITVKKGEEEEGRGEE